MWLQFQKRGKKRSRYKPYQRKTCVYKAFYFQHSKAHTPSTSQHTVTLSISALLHFLCQQKNDLSTNSHAHHPVNKMHTNVSRVACQNQHLPFYFSCRPTRQMKCWQNHLDLAVNNEWPCTSCRSESNCRDLTTPSKRPTATIHPPCHPL